MDIEYEDYALLIPDYISLHTTGLKMVKMVSSRKKTASSNSRVHSPMQVNIVYKK